MNDTPDSRKDRMILQRIQRAWQLQQLVDEIAVDIAKKVQKMTPEEIEAEYQRLVRERRKRKPN